MARDKDDAARDRDTQRAIRLLTELSSTPPQHATADSVARLAEAVGLLQHAVGSSLWFRACDAWASHLLEVKSGDHRANVLAAREIYGTMVAQAEHAPSFDDWYLAQMGLGNTILADPGAGSTGSQMAMQFFDALLPVVRENGAPMQIALALGRAADAHARVQTGDPDRELERAIQLQTEAVETLSRIDDADANDRLSHALYSLGRFYAQRRSGVRSQNLDVAIQALQRARDLRPADRDPTGRARVLRALALLLPDWSAPPSRAHAEQLAAQAREEADRLAGGQAEIDQHQEPVFTRLQRQRSALRVDFEDLYALPLDQRRPWLEGHIKSHREVLEGIDRSAMPSVWADWMAGLGRLLGRLAHVGASHSELETAHECFAQAAASLDPSDDARLYRDTMSAWGEFSHEIGHFEAAYHAYNEAAEVSRRIMTMIADPAHRLVEIENTRGYGLFGAYAAVRLQRPEAAARLAELECNRSIADLLQARQVMVHATPERRSAFAEILGRIRSTEGRLREAQRELPEGVAEDMRGRLADAAGIDPSVLQFRLTNPGTGEAHSRRDEVSELRETLMALRGELQSLWTPGADRAEGGVLPHAGIDEITRAAASVGRPVVYLLATVHGGAAIVVMPSGAVEVMQLPELDSDLTGVLLHGDGAIVGFRSLDLQAIEAAHVCLERIADRMGTAAIGPVTAFLRSRGCAEGFIVVALGRVGVLPLHLAAQADMPLSYAPSARILAEVRPGADAFADATMLVVANPARDDAQSLEFAMAEGRWLSKLGGTVRKVVLLAAEQAAYDPVRKAVASARLVHFACHGQFRPSDPLESHLELAGQDELKLGDLFMGAIDMGRARLVTLGACDSGLTERYRASDEATGFPFALMLGGVPAVVSAMWPVDDAAGMLFTIRFYELLLTQQPSPAHAVASASKWLRTATVPDVLARIRAVRTCLAAGDTDAADQLGLLEEELEAMGAAVAPFSSPVDWGAFCLTGQ